MASEIINNRKRQRFEVVVSGVQAYLDYSLENKRLTLIHTEVPPVLEGQGLGGRIVKFALDYAQEQGWAIIPECSFVLGYLGRHPEYNHLVWKK